MASPPQTVLVNGATGNIGVSAIIAALRNNYKVLAIVRNQTSAEKLFKHVGTKEGITTVEADITAEDGVQSVVDKVKAGELPAFQHVYSCCGYWEDTPLPNLSTQTFRQTMNVNLEANYFCYRATIPYLLTQSHPDSTFTQCTGGAPEAGIGGATAIAQGALFAMMSIAAKDNEKTNVRCNEVYLCTYVKFDEEAEGVGAVGASEFAGVYEKILKGGEIRGCRVSVYGREDLERLKVEKKLR